MTGIVSVKSQGPTPGQAKAPTRLWLALGCLLFLAGMGIAAPAFAQVCTDCSCVDNGTSILRTGEDADGNYVTNSNEQHQAELTRELIEQNFQQQQTWFTSQIQSVIIPQVQLMAEHFVTLAMYQAMAIGTMLDSKQQIETIRLFNQLTAEAMRDYQPNVGMCIFGTNIRSLAMAEQRGNYARYVLAERSKDRQTGHRNALGAEGLHYDLRARMAQLKTRYCDVQQDAGFLQNLCGQSAEAATRNADINYTEIVDQPQTMNVDFTPDGAAANTSDEQDLFALADNLYANNLMTRLPEADFNQQQNQEKLIDTRALIAKRSVAENAFYSIVGMKAQGSVAVDPDSPATVKLASADTASYMKVLLAQLGVPAADMDNLIGTAPSYFAQMNVLTKLIYQRPEFYTDLYDTPANVERKSASMLAIQLMQNFDIWDSSLRQEEMLSVWLELDLKKYQNDIQDKIGRPKASGR
jgi:hypothetical protein